MPITYVPDTAYGGHHVLNGTGNVTVDLTSSPKTVTFAEFRDWQTGKHASRTLQVLGSASPYCFQSSDSDRMVWGFFTLAGDQISGRIVRRHTTVLEGGVAQEDDVGTFSGTTGW